MDIVDSVIDNMFSSVSSNKHPRIFSLEIAVILQYSYDIILLKCQDNSDLIHFVYNMCKTWYFYVV